MIFSPRGSANERAGPPSQARRNHPELSIRRQCAMLGVARSSVYRQPRPVNDNDLEAMRRIDALFTARLSPIALFEGAAVTSSDGRC